MRFRAILFFLPLHNFFSCLLGLLAPSRGDRPIIAAVALRFREAQSLAGTGMPRGRGRCGRADRRAAGRQAGRQHRRTDEHACSSRHTGHFFCCFSHHRIAYTADESDPASQDGCWTDMLAALRVHRARAPVPRGQKRSAAGERLCIAEASIMVRRTPVVERRLEGMASGQENWGEWPVARSGLGLSLTLTHSFFFRCVRRLSFTTHDMPTSRKPVRRWCVRMCCASHGLCV